MRGAIPPLPQYAFMAWCLVKHRDRNQQQMNFEANEVCKIAKNAFGKSVYSNMEYTYNAVFIMKFSRAISRVRWFSFLETNVSKIISVLVLRVVELMWVRWTTPGKHQIVYGVHLLKLF
jgi:hypothetical protein